MRKILLVLTILIISGCTTTKMIAIPSGERSPNIYEIYQVVLDTFQELTIPVQFQDPPYSLESVWMYWPPHTTNRILGFPLTWWKYRVLIQENVITLEGEARGFSLFPLTPLIVVNFIPVPTDWIVKTLRQNLKSMDITVKIHIKHIAGN